MYHALKYFDAVKDSMTNPEVQKRSNLFRMLIEFGHDKISVKILILLLIPSAFKDNSFQLNSAVSEIMQADGQCRRMTSYCS